VAISQEAHDPNAGGTLTRADQSGAETSARSVIPKVAVVVIGLNVADSLSPALDSIAHSAVSPVEVVYVDAGSTDGSEDVARQHRSKVLVLAGLGRLYPGAARNAGLAVLDCDYVHFLDGDMRLEPNWLAVGVSTLERRQDLGCVCGRTIEMSRDGLLAAVVALDWETKSLGPAVAPSGGGTFRISALRGIGGYSGSLVAAEETEIGARLSSAGWGIEVLPDCMCRHRLGFMTTRRWLARSVRTGQAQWQLMLLDPSTWCRPRFLRAELYCVIAAVAGLSMAVCSSRRWYGVGFSLFVSLALVGRLARARTLASGSAVLGSASAVLNYAGMPVVSIGFTREACRTAMRAVQKRIRT